MSTAGAGSIGGGFTAGLGLADDGGALQGFHATGSLHHLGYDFVREGLSAMGGAGIEYFYQSMDAPLGLRVGMDGGFAGVASDTLPGLLLGFAGLSVGGRYALDVDREFAFVDVGGIVGGGFGLEGDDGEVSRSALVGLVGLTFGWLRVESFHF